MGGRALFLVSLTLAGAACSTQAAPPSAPTVVPAITGPNRVSGVLVTNQTRTPVVGATMTLTEIGGASATTSVTTGPGGEFSFPSVPADQLWLSITAPGHLERVTNLQVTGSKQDLVVDVIATAPPFSLDFFRQFARRGFESPTNLGHLKPWSTDPSFYVRTVVEDTGELVSDVVVEGLRRVFTNAVPELSGRRRTMAAFEFGPESRAGRPDWINVTFVRGLAVGGEATVGPSAAPTMRIRYDPSLDDGPIFSGCESVMVEVADHEIVHTMGYSHTDQTGNDFRSGKGCPGAGRPERVRYHADVMYTRVHGNLDRDRDPWNFAITTGASDAPIVASCPIHIFR